MKKNCNLAANYLKSIITRSFSVLVHNELKHGKKSKICMSTVCLKGKNVLFWKIFERQFPRRMRPGVKNFFFQKTLLILVFEVSGNNRTKTTITSKTKINVFSYFMDPPLESFLNNVDFSL